MRKRVGKQPFVSSSESWALFFFLLQILGESGPSIGHMHFFALCGAVVSLAAAVLAYRNRGLLFAGTLISDFYLGKWPVIAGQVVQWASTADSTC